MKQNGFIYATRNATKHNYKSVITLFTQKGNIYNNKIYIIIIIINFMYFLPDSCAKCGHSIAKHIHEFWIEDGYQEYRMECMLCGLGEDSVSVLPKDPRKVSQIPALF